MATLAEVRADFIRATERYDLITSGDISTNADNGANAWINRGQRYLDQRVEHVKTIRRHQVLLPLGAFQILIPGLIAASRVQIAEAGEGRADISLNYATAADFRQVENSALFSDYGSGKPSAWTDNVITLSSALQDKVATDYSATKTITDATNASPIVVTSGSHNLVDHEGVVITEVAGNIAANGPFQIDNVTDDTFELVGSTGDGAYTSGGTITPTILDYEDINFGFDYEERGILFNTKADGNYTIILFGKFFSRTLAADSDVSFWTKEHDNLLVMASALQLEKTMQVRARNQYWLEAMAPDILELDKSLAEFDEQGLRGRMGG